MRMKNIEDSQDCLVLLAYFIWKVVETDVHTSVFKKIKHEIILMFQIMYYYITQYQRDT